MGTTLASNAVIENIVANYIKQLSTTPSTPCTQYYLMTSHDVKLQSGFCSQFCAWHGYCSPSLCPTILPFGFIGDPAQCPSACASQTPNGNFEADSMINLLAHELAETVTDFQLNAWFDSNGAETGDKCAWTFGTSTPITSGANSGAYYNVVLQNNLKVYVQQLWRLTTMDCGLAL